MAQQADDTAIHVGAVIFADYTYDLAPTFTDSSGQTAHGNRFQITRAYVNVTGQISHALSFRVTPDITREVAPASTLNGSFAFRLKYAYANVDLSKLLRTGSWVRFGLTQTPWLDFIENIYRYRFQGQTMAEREGYLVSSDAGVSFRYAAPRDMGDVHIGVYNGEGYSKAEANAQKSVQMRVTVRPFYGATHALHGIRLTGFVDRDNYDRGLPRNRALGAITLEQQYFFGGVDILKTNDRGLRSTDYSAWIAPRTTHGLEGLLRYDHVDIRQNNGGDHNRVIAGVAYWFVPPTHAALMIDFERTHFGNSVPSVPAQSRIALHTLLTL